MCRNGEPWFRESAASNLRAGYFFLSAVPGFCLAEMALFLALSAAFDFLAFWLLFLSFDFGDLSPIIYCFVSLLVEFRAATELPEGFRNWNRWFPVKDAVSGEARTRDCGGKILLRMAFAGTSGD